jgi:hypothetical protein
MKKKIFYTFLIFCFVNNVFAQSQNTNQIPPAKRVTQVAPGTCQNFGNKLRKCERFKCSQPVPNHPGEVVFSEIKGKTKNNLCHVFAENKKEGTTECVTDQVTLNAAAVVWEEYLRKGLPIISLSDPNHQVIISALRRGDCKVKTPTGEVDMSFLNALPDPEQLNNVSEAISGILQEIQ